MRTRLAIFFLAAALFAPAAAQAAKPTTVTGLLKLCATGANRAACQSRMRTEEDSAAMAITEGDGKGLCVPPDGISQDQANEKILVWLRQNRGTHAMIVFDGIQAAIKGLWNCETSLGNAGTGLDSLGVPETVAQTLGPFLSFCDGDANRVKCANEIVAVDVLAMTGDGSHCTAPDSTTGIELSDRVLAWLRANPQPPQTDTTIAVMTAIDTIWPCH